MDERLIIQLGASKNKRAINVDQNINIQLNESPKEILNYNESSIIDVAQLFEVERQESEVYRIYGRIDFISIINGLKKQYKTINDFFTPPRLGDELSGTTKSLPYCFDLYLCYPSTGKTSLGNDEYLRNYVVASKLNNSEIYKSGFGRNIYFNYTHSFDFNIDFNVEGYRDAFGKPITELYLFFVYKIQNNGDGHSETLIQKNWNGSETTITYNSTTGYDIGTVLTGDRVSYKLENFSETLVDRMRYLVYFPYQNNTRALQFEYNPFIPIKIRDFGDEIITANISGGTESDIEIPSYALPVDNKGNRIWKDILPNGYVDPITGNGVDYPFINKRHYIFKTVTLPMVPNLTHNNTNTVFTNIKFGPNSKINTTPNTNLNSLGNRCT